MGGLFNAVGQGLSTAGYAAGDTFTKMAVQENASDLELQRQMRLREFEATLKDAPLNRLAAKAKNYADEDVPVAAPPVTSLTGAGNVGINPDVEPDSKFSGNPADVLRGILALPDGIDKQQALAQLRSQVGADSTLNAQAVAGKTRKRSPGEALDAAMENAQLSDLPAFVAGKAALPEKTITVPDGATVIDRNGKVIFQNDGKAQRALEIEDRKDARATAAEDARDRRQLQQLAHAEAMAELRDGGGKAPAGYRKKEDGNLEFIPGGPADPENKNKPLPASTASGLLTNQDNLRRAQRALALAKGETVDGLKGDANATGMKGYLPNGLLNRADSGGVDTRAAIADLGSMVIHDRSGAAVSATEFPRLQPFIPSASDDAATVKKKLGLFVTNYEAIIADQVNFFRESGYKVPAEVLKRGNASAASEQQTPAPMLDSVEAEMRRRGLIK
jgi:hypothetical protein